MKLAGTDLTGDTKWLKRELEQAGIISIDRTISKSSKPLAKGSEAKAGQELRSGIRTRRSAKDLTFHIHETARSENNLVLMKHEW